MAASIDIAGRKHRESEIELAIPFKRVFGVSRTNWILTLRRRRGRIGRWKEVVSFLCKVLLNGASRPLCYLDSKPPNRKALAFLKRHPERVDGLPDADGEQFFWGVILRPARK